MNRREKLFRAIFSRRHRYDFVRVLVATFSLAVLWAIPLMSGLAQVDLWGQEHLLFFRPAPLGQAGGGVCLAIFCLYFVTFLSNALVGRLFCGWGCPVGYLSRLGEDVSAKGREPKKRLIHQLSGAGFSAMLAGSLMCWWVSPAVLYASSPQAIAVAVTVFAVLVTLAYLHSRIWRWGFCKSACPIGLYYTIVAPAKNFGIHFDNSHGACLECKACEFICPVGLDPRNLFSNVERNGGIPISEAPGINHCLKCGDCIDVCEFQIQRNSAHEPPLHFGWYNGDVQVDKGLSPIEVNPPEKTSDSSTDAEAEKDRETVTTKK